MRTRQRARRSFRRVGTSQARRWWWMERSDVVAQRHKATKAPRSPQRPGLSGHAAPSPQHEYCAAPRDRPAPAWPEGCSPRGAAALLVRTSRLAGTRSPSPPKPFVALCLCARKSDRCSRVAGLRAKGRKHTTHTSLPLGFSVRPTAVVNGTSRFSRTKAQSHKAMQKIRALSPANSTLIDPRSIFSIPRTPNPIPPSSILCPLNTCS
jgi:hypothetical protein